MEPWKIYILFKSEFYDGKPFFYIFCYFLISAKSVYKTAELILILHTEGAMGRRFF